MRLSNRFQKNSLGFAFELLYNGTNLKGKSYPHTVQIKCGWNSFSGIEAAQKTTYLWRMSMVSFPDLLCRTPSIKRPMNAFLRIEYCRLDKMDPKAWRIQHFLVVHKKWSFGEGKKRPVDFWYIRLQFSLSLL